MFNRFLHRILINKVSKKKITVAWVILILIAIFAACSPKAGSGFLKFIFDGVPDKNPKDSVVTSLIIVSDSSKKNPIVSVQPDDVSGIFYHTPYKDRACAKCHNADVPDKISFSQDEFCYSCHEDFQKKYSFIHGPVAGGFCTACHSPHYSDNKKLLVRKGQELCLNCHTKDLIMQNEEHPDIGKTICTECHNPHGGSDRYLSN